MTTSVLERAALTSRFSEYTLPGVAFDIHPEFEPIPADFDTLTAGNNYSILVTGVDAESDSGNRPAEDLAELLIGRIIEARLHRNRSGSLTWFSTSMIIRSTDGPALVIPAAFLYGVPVEQHIESSLPDDVLLALRPQPRRVWKSRVATFRNGDATEALALEAAAPGETLNNPEAITTSFASAQWVKVRRIGEAAAAVQPAPFSRIPAGAVVQHSTAEIVRRSVDRDESGVQVLVTELGFPDRDNVTDGDRALVGKVWSLRAFDRTDLWNCSPATRDLMVSAGGSGDRRYFRGAVVSPDLVDGRHYLLSDGRAGVWVGGTRRFVPYRENTSSLNFSDLLTEDQIKVPGYVEVTITADFVQTLPPVGAEPAAPAPVPVEIADYNNVASPESPLLGLAVSDRPAMNTELVKGTTYLAWPKGWRRGGSVTLYVYVGDIKLTENAATTEPTMVFKSKFTATAGGRLMEESHWGDTITPAARFKAEYNYTAAVPPVNPEGTTGLDTRFATHIETVKDQREKYIEALNDMANDKDWCGEYETVMAAVGFPGRRKPTGDFDVEVSASWTYTNHGPSSYFDGQMSTLVADDNISGFEMSELTITGTGTVTVRVRDFEYSETDDDLSDALRDHIDTSMVEGALEDQLSNGGSFDVGNWDYESYEAV